MRSAAWILVSLAWSLALGCLQEMPPPEPTGRTVDQTGPGIGPALPPPPEVSSEGCEVGEEPVGDKIPSDGALSALLAEAGPDDVLEVYVAHRERIANPVLEDPRDLAEAEAALAEAYEAALVLQRCLIASILEQGGTFVDISLSGVVAWMTPPLIVRIAARTDVRQIDANCPPLRICRY